MNLSGHQPCYLPSLQLFAKIKRSDIFAHCGHLQFVHRSWHHRNFILLRGKRHRLSIPIPSIYNLSPIREVWFADQKWKEDHLKTIALAYGNSPFFEDYYPTLKDIIYAHPHSLEKLNINLTNRIAEWLGLDIKLASDRPLNFQGDAVDKIIQMCKAVGAKSYLSNDGAREYIAAPQAKRMIAAGILPEWLDFKDPDEEPLSAVHHLFTVGPEAARLI